MKIFVKADNETRNPDIGNWYLIADSALTNTGKPFYLPENKGKVWVKLGEVLRINRLGKSITPKFASRYYSDKAPAVHFTLPEYKETLVTQGLPQDASRSFDRSLFVGNFSAYREEINLELKKNGEKVAEIKREDSSPCVARMLQEVSEMNTMKIGDLMVPLVSDPVEINIGDILEVFGNGEKEFEVRVK